MGQPAARMNDTVVAVDIHILLVPSPVGPVPTPLPHPFNGRLQTNLSADVLIDGLAAATVGSIAVNIPPHIPTGPGSFSIPPRNQGTVQLGSTTVLIGGKGAARAGDTVLTCNDPVDLPAGSITTGSTGVLIG
jgi:uncharacterized Zn-binding protein involved in type VI secretion